MQICISLLSIMKNRHCHSRISSCLLRFSLCELVIICQQIGGSLAGAAGCRSDRPAVVDVLPSPVASLQDEKSIFDVTSANVVQFHGHFAKRSPVRNVEGLICTVIMNFFKVALDFKCTCGKYYRDSAVYYMKRLLRADMHYFDSWNFRTRELSFPGTKVP